MFFRDISGEAVVKTKLINMVNTGRISHAMLFFGPDGNGKLALAIAFAQYLFCTNRGAEDSCGECPSCKKVEKLIHPDFHFVFPVVKTKKFSKPLSNDYMDLWREFILEIPYHGYNEWLNVIKPENQQAGIFTQESAEILRKLSFKPYESDYKVMIIWMPDKMNLTTSNKLLKILEEPPVNTVFILVTDHQEKIISTIRSRTQIIHIPKITYRDMYESLKRKYNFADEKLNDIVRVADGNFIKAEEIIKNEPGGHVNEMFDRFVQFMRNSFGLKVNELIDFSEVISGEGREYQKNFLEYSLRLLRENFVLNVGSDKQDEIIFLTSNERSFADKFSKYINKSNILGIYDEFSEAYDHIERNGYGKLVFLDLGLKLSKLLRVLDES